MDSGSSSDEQGSFNSRKNKKLYHRHTSHQIQQLEAFFKRCAHPDDNQRNQLANDIGLEAKQVKFWFQNKRTQMKTQGEKLNNSSLRAENEKIQCENHAIREALKNVLCPACGGPPSGDEERQRSLEQLKHQNACLKEEHERMVNLLSRYIGKPLPEVEKLIAASAPKGSSSELYSLRHQASSSNNNDNYPLLQGNGKATSVAMERTLMRESAANAFDELVRLLQVDEPLWTNYYSEGRPSQLMIHRDAYENIIMRNTNLLKRTSGAHNARFESSKFYGEVGINGIHLVDMLLDSSKWVDLFPTIVTRANTIEVIENGVLGSKHDALQLMYGRLHILSPLVPSREFYFLRHCKNIEEGLWIIVDVSFDCDNKSFSPTNCWKLPSGCMIQDMHNGNSKVTWIEHVQVDDKSQLHKLYKDLVINNSAIAFGAEKWVGTLQRMSQRYVYSLKSNAQELGGGSYGGVMKLCQRMVKRFCEMLGMSGKLDFPQLSEANSSGIRISVRKGVDEGQPFGMIITAATSLWLPLPTHVLFDFFMDDTQRFQWDSLSDGRPGHELVRIPTGDYPGNCISIKRPLIPNQNNMVLIQESCVESSGSLIAYAPIDYNALGSAITTNEDTSKVPILPSGIVITCDGRVTDHNRPGTSSSNNIPGSLLTLAFQILVSSDHVNVESVANINALVSSTVQKIKACLNCSHVN